MMKKQIALVALLFLGMSCFNASAQFKKFNLGKAIQAGKDAAQAISLSDADIAAMSKEYMEWMDKHNPLTKPDSEYGKRLERLTGNIKEVDGMKVNFGVYEVVDVNAFALYDFHRFPALRLFLAVLWRLFRLGSAAFCLLAL